MRWELYTKITHGELVELPTGKKAVGCKWVFIVKHKVDGSIERYKAWLVEKSFTQTYDIDYEETLTLIAKMKSIWVLLSFSTSLVWPLQQLDVKNTFLHGDLEEEDTWNFLLVLNSPQLRVKCVNWRKPYMDWNNLRECGLRDSSKLCRDLAINRARQIMHCWSNIRHRER